MLGYIKTTIQLILFPIFAPIGIILFVVHDWKNDKSWLHSLLESNNPFKWALFVLVAPIVFPLIAFMFIFFETWDELAE